jgi:Zn-dependent protease
VQKISGNGIHLFRVFGIDVFLHWSWIIVAVIELQARQSNYTSQVWNIAEYLTLFAIVLLHEFGHALACRSVGGIANRIMLWPLGGVAFVNPPQRPGAMLWSIVAGPLVNVVLLPITFALYHEFGHGPNGNVNYFLYMLMVINGVLLAFNLLPIYPLDGGQILRSLLWFVIGRAYSLMVATVIGVIGAVGFGIFALYKHNLWFGILAAFALMQCWSGFQQARFLRRLLHGPRHDAYACPACGASPPAGNYWRCDRCGIPFDTFATGATCPNCAATFERTRCLHCGQLSPISAWTRQPKAVMPLAQVYVPPGDAY